MLSRSPGEDIHPRPEVLVRARAFARRSSRQPPCLVAPAARDRAAATFARTSHASAVGIHGVPASTRTCLHSPKKNLTRKRPAPGAFHRCQHARCKVRQQPMIRPMIAHEQLEPCLTRCVHAQGNQCSELFSRHRRRAQERACAASTVALRTDAVKNASAKEAGRVRALGRWST